MLRAVALGIPAHRDVMPRRAVHFLDLLDASQQRQESLSLPRIVPDGVEVPSPDTPVPPPRGAKELNRTLLSALRKANKRTTLRAGDTTEHYFDYVLKKTIKN